MNQASKKTSASKPPIVKLSPWMNDMGTCPIRISNQIFFSLKRILMPKNQSYTWSLFFVSQSIWRDLLTAGQAQTCITSSSAPCLWLPAVLVVIFKSLALKKLQHSLHDLQSLNLIHTRAFKIRLFSLVESWCTLSQWVWTTDCTEASGPGPVFLPTRSPIMYYARIWFWVNDVMMHRNLKKE